MRISREVALQLAPFCPPGQTAKTLGPEMEPWISEQYELAVDELMHLEPTPRKGERGRHREVVTLRLPAWHCRRLGIIAEAWDVWIGELVERWLVAWIARKARAAQPAGPEAGRGTMAVAT